MTPPTLDPPEEPALDPSRRTWLAAEWTWLAWWRTGLASAAVAVAVGRLLPGLTRGPWWPYRALGLGYGALTVGVLIAGALRQRRTAKALVGGGFDQLSSQLGCGSQRLRWPWRRRHWSSSRLRFDSWAVDIAQLRYCRTHGLHRQSMHVVGLWTTAHSAVTPGATPMKDEREPKLRELASAGFDAIRQIDASTAMEGDALASAFLCAAWPSIRAQNQ